MQPEEGFESEWGSEPGMDAALEAFCQAHGFKFMRLRLPHPHDFSWLAFRAHEVLCERSGVEPQGVVVETFTQYDPQAVLAGGLLPLWLIFNTDDSLAFLKRCLPAFPAGKPIFFSGLVTFSRTPDMVAWEGWAQALADKEWVNIGARPGRYPEDLLALLQGQRKLREWVGRNPAPIKQQLAPADLLALAREMSTASE